MKAKQLSGQSVTTGFIVRKKWVTKKPDPKHESKVIDTHHIKTVSQSYMARDAADIFRNLAEKNNASNPVDGEFDVSFFVTENIGDDGLPKGF